MDRSRTIYPSCSHESRQLNPRDRRAQESAPIRISPAPIRERSRLRTENTFAAQGNAPKEATVKILQYKDMEPFFIKGECDEP
jgi:hypothetical protein